MTKSYQLVAWTDKGQVRMIPSEVTDYIHAELEAIDRQADSIRYRSEQERGGILKLSQAYEKLAVGLLRLGRIEDAFEQYARAAQCCLQSSEWDDTEWGEILCKPLRGRFFAMFCVCKDSPATMLLIPSTASRTTGIPAPETPTRPWPTTKPCTSARTRSIAEGGRKIPHPLSLTTEFEERGYF